MKRLPSIAFSTFFSVASWNLLAQSYISRTVALFKQVLVILKKEKGFTRGIIEIINELLTTLVYKAPLTVTEQEAAIFLGILIQKTNRFERTPLLEEVAELISIYIIVLKEDDFKEPEGTSKFVKASGWVSSATPKAINKASSSKTPNSGTSSWNILGISESMPGINFIGVNEKEDNPWKSPQTGRLISPSGTPNIGLIIVTSKTTKNIPLETITNRPLRG